MPATARRKGGRPLPLAGLLIAGALATACAAPAPPPPPAAAPAAPPARADLVVLLPGRDGKVGAIVVQEGGRETALNTAYASAQTGAGGRLEPGQASPDEVRAIFGDALAAEPPRPVTFILYFVEATDQFTPESQALVGQILVAIASRPAPELTVAGHTDAVGTDQYNDALSLRRAERVAGAPDRPRHRAGQRPRHRARQAGAAGADARRGCRAAQPAGRDHGSLIPGPPASSRSGGPSHWTASSVTSSAGSNGSRKVRTAPTRSATSRAGSLWAGVPAALVANAVTRVVPNRAPPGSSASVTPSVTISTVSPGWICREGGLVDEVVEHAERRAGPADQPLDGPALRVEDPRRLVAGAAVPELARVDVEDGRHERHEERLRIVPAHLRVRLAHRPGQLGGVPGGDAPVEGLGRRHEQAGGQALPGDVADQEQQAVPVEEEEVEEVAADDARRLHHRRDPEAAFAGERAFRSREKPELDAARRLELAREPGGRLALLLEPLPERPALTVGLGQRAAQRGRIDRPRARSPA